MPADNQEHGCEREGGREGRSGRRHRTMGPHVAILELIVILGNQDGTSHRSDSPWRIVDEQTRKNSALTIQSLVFLCRTASDQSFEYDLW